MKRLLTALLPLMLAWSTPACVAPPQDQARDKATQQSAPHPGAARDGTPTKISAASGAARSQETRDQETQGQEKTNRDRHGPPDVERYIRMLEDPGRRAWDDPDKVIEALELQPADWVVDLGCGPGFYTLPLARAVNNGLVFALDVEPRQLDRLNEHLAEQNLTNVIPVLTPPDVPRAPLGRIDVVVVVDTYHHLEHRGAYLARLAPLLEPGGRIVVVDFYKKPLPVGPPSPHKIACETVLAEVQGAGFRLREQLDILKYQYVLVFERGNGKD
jgi:SAM-dependent methyltransferase